MEKKKLFFRSRCCSRSEREILSSLEGIQPGLCPDLCPGLLRHHHQQSGHDGLVHGTTAGACSAPVLDGALSASGDASH